MYLYRKFTLQYVIVYILSIFYLEEILEKIILKVQNLLLIKVQIYLMCKC